VTSFKVLPHHLVARNKKNDENNSHDEVYLKLVHNFSLRQTYLLQ
jgi:hypothetical protein